MESVFQGISNKVLPEFNTFYDGDPKEKEVLNNWLPYFDYATICIVQQHHKDFELIQTAEIAAIVCKLFIRGNQELNILSDNAAIMFVEALAFNKIPNRQLVYQLVDYMVRLNTNNLPQALVYMLPLLAYTKTPNIRNHSTRSHQIISLIHQLFACKAYPDLYYDIRCDGLSFLPRVLPILKQIINSTYTDYNTYVITLLDTLRIISVCYLSAILMRGSNWKPFCTLGNNVLTQLVTEHRAVVKQHYQTNLLQQ